MQVLHPLQSLRDDLRDEPGKAALLPVKKHALLRNYRLQRETLREVTRGEDVTQLDQLVIELFHITLVVELREALRSSFPRLRDGFDVVFGQACVYEVGAYQNGGSSLACVAVYEDLPTRLSHEVHDLNDVEELVEFGVCEVLPVAVEEGDLVLHE